MRTFTGVMTTNTENMKTYTTNDLTKTFGNQLRNSRKSEHLTQTELGKLLYPEWNDSSCKYIIKDLEEDRVYPTSGELSKLNDLFKTTFISKISTKDERGRGKKRPNAVGPKIKVPEEFADKIKAYRNQNNLTQKEFASKIGVSGPEVSKIEANGVRNMSVKVYHAIENLIGSLKDKEPEVKVSSLDVSTARCDKCFLENVSKMVKTKEEEEALCNKVGVVPRYFRRSQEEIAPITLELARKVSKYLNVPIEDLCKDPQKEKLKEEIRRLQEKLAEM